MICWKCLRKMSPWTDTGNRRAWECLWCGNKQAGNHQARADRFMALVAAESANADPTTTVAVIVDCASHTMAEIERRVEAGELFKGE